MRTVVETGKGLVKVNSHNNVLYGEYEADGTAYRAIAVKIDRRMSCGWLGSINEGWLVASGMSKRKACLLTDNGPLHPSYVGKHFGLVGVDAENFTTLLEIMLDRGGQ